MRALIVTLVLLLGAGPVLAQTAPSGRAELESLSRSLVARSQPQDPSMPVPPSGKLGRAKAGLWSLLLPGMSQYRAGHRTRAFLFFGAEAAVWTSFAVFRIQGHKREESYEEFATVFASVASTDHDEDYWRNVASYRSSDAYNMDVRRDQRSGAGDLGPEVSEADAWRWISEDRFNEFQRLRADSLDAYDRATLVTLFAILNRVVSFVDAVRSAGADPDPFADEAGDLSLRWDAQPFGPDPGATLGLRTRF